MEVSRISQDAPGLESQKYGQMQPVLAQGLSLKELSDVQRVYYRAEEPDTKLYILKDREKRIFTGYDSFESATRACTHVLEREGDKFQFQQTNLQDPHSLALGQERYNNIKSKYGVLAEQFPLLREERRALELAKVDLEQLALAAGELQAKQEAVLTHAQNLAQFIQFAIQPPTLDHHLLAYLGNMYAKVKERMAKIPVSVWPGWELVPHVVY